MPSDAAAISPETRQDGGEGRLGFSSKEVATARIQGVASGGSLLARIAFFMSQRKLGKVVRLVRVHALNPSVLLGYGQMEKSQGKSKSFPPAVKALAKVRVGMRIGCPF